MGNICVCVHSTKKAGVAQGPGCKVVTKYEKGNIKRINQYTVLKELGPCSFGMVSLVVDSQQKQFAMRCGQRRFLSPTFELASEVETLLKLNHDNVLSLHEVVEDARHPEVYVIFEHAEGGPLMRIDATGSAVEGPFDVSEVKRFIPQIFDGLMYLHQNGVSHGDLHPGNILLNRNRQLIKLGDFRMAQMFQTPPPMGVNPMFSSPEMCREGCADCNEFFADIWAAGVTIYTLMWGHVPWKPVTDLVTLHNAIQFQPIVFHHADRFDETLLLLLTRMLERDVSKRITLNEARNSPWLTSSPSIRCLGELSRITEQQEAGKTRVLIVEDVSVVRKTLVRMFVSILKDPEMVEVNTVASGPDALQECCHKSYTLILMDVHKSRVTWGEVTEGIRQYEREQQLPSCNIVGVTADNPEEVASGCLKAGMNSVVSKPLVVSTLRELCIAYGIEVNSSKSSSWLDGDNTNVLLSSPANFLRKATVPNAYEVRSSPGTTTHGADSAELRKSLSSDSRKCKAGSELASLDSTLTLPSQPLRITSLLSSDGEQAAVASKPEQVGLKDPKKASLAWMCRNRKGRKVPFKFVDCQASDCMPWAVGMALREVQRVELLLGAAQTCRLHDLVKQACETECSLLGESERVQLDSLSEIVKNTIESFLQAVRLNPGQPQLETYACAAQGVRASMEDTWCAVDHLRRLYGVPVPEGQEDDVFVGLFDGHSGSEAAEFARDHLQYYLAKHPLYEADLVAAIKGSFRETDEKFIARAPGSEAGTTATAIVIRGSKIYVGNAGDARVVLCQAGNPVLLNKIHRPDDAAESELVQRRGGAVYFYNGAWRVNATLSVSRSLGDASFRNYITCEPEVRVHTIDPQTDEFIVVASDGLWDHMTPKEVVEFVRQCRSEVDDARVNGPKEGEDLLSDNGSMDNYRIVTAALVDTALQSGSTDNVSCVIIYFPRPRLPSSFDVS
eukprot:GGOE01008419.1.p1 GENE.GGOE01008419.1~~GGOE01008419.1.p1  ORF type:complete len:958 (-),score=209.56 GGOE01008419.1:947-3820(-)